MWHDLAGSEQLPLRQAVILSGQENFTRDPLLRFPQAGPGFQQRRHASEEVPLVVAASPTLKERVRAKAKTQRSRTKAGNQGLSPEGLSC